jgi:C4-dicarboxylate transporter
MFEATLPIFIVAAAFSLTRNLLVSLLICMMIGVLIIFLHKKSLREAFKYLKGFRKI